MNEYQPKEVTIDNLTIKIPEIITKLKVENHPLKYEINDLFYQKKTNILSLNSEIINYFKNDLWNIKEIKLENKIKEKYIIREINKFNIKFDVCFLNSKKPLWKIFDKISFNILILESSENVEDMDLILNPKGYLKVGNIYFNKSFLLNN